MNMFAFLDSVSRDQWILGGVMVLTVGLSIYVLVRLSTSRQEPGTVSVSRVLWNDKSGYTPPADWWDVANDAIYQLSLIIEDERNSLDRFTRQWQDKNLELKLLNEFSAANGVPAEPAVDTDNPSAVREREYRNHIRKQVAFQVDDAIRACRRPRAMAC